MSTTPHNQGDRTATHVLFVDQLDREIERRQRELDALLQARSVLRGVDQRHHRSVTSPPNGQATRAATTTAGVLDGSPATVSQGVEQLLQTAPKHEMHLDDIQKELETRYQIKVSRKNLANTLNRWIARGKRFDRIAANTFVLR